MAELSCGGTSFGAMTSSPRTRPSASATAIRSAPSARTGASARRCASSTAIRSPVATLLLGPALLHVDERDVEDEIGVGRHGVAGAVVAVAELGRDAQLAAPAHLHTVEALFPAADDLAGAELERERFVAIDRAVELLLRVGE